MMAIRSKENAVSLELRGGWIWQLNYQIDNQRCKTQYRFIALIIKEGNTDTK